MNTKTLIAAVVVLALTAIWTPITQAGTAFTYQGRLTDGGQPAHGAYDLRFGLYTAQAGGNQVGGMVTNSFVLWLDHQSS